MITNWVFFHQLCITIWHERNQNLVELIYALKLLVEELQSSKC